MEGVLYLTDENNHKRYVQIDLTIHGSIVQDMLDRLTIESRKEEESFPLDEVLKDLEEKGDLSKYV